MAVSPYVELLVRRVYWRNAGLMTAFKKRVRTPARKERGTSAGGMADYGRLLDFLRRHGVHGGALVVVHSAYGPLKRTGLEPEQIIEGLLALIRPGGTLAMPAMPAFANAGKGKNYVTDDISGQTFHYDVNRTPTTTGVLPKKLLAMPGARRSRFPINTMVAVGALAADMMAGNLDGDRPLPCGTGSSWDFCARHNAVIVGLGIDLTHSLTMIHVAEDRLDERWPIRGWYRNKRFTIRDGDFFQEISLRERHPRWGALHFAERTLCRDLIAAGLLKTAAIDGIRVEVLAARDLLPFLDSRNQKGYPYFGVRRHLG